MPKKRKTTRKFNYNSLKPRNHLKIQSAMDVDTKNLPIIATNDHIVGMFDGDGNINLLLAKGKNSKTVANGLRFIPRCIFSQAERTGYLPLLKKYFLTNCQIESSIQIFNPAQTNRAPNLEIRGQENCKKLTNLLLQGNLLSPKLFQTVQMKIILENIYEKKDPKELAIFNQRFNEKLEILNQKENQKIQKQKEKIEILNQKEKSPRAKASPQQLIVAKTELEKMELAKIEKIQQLKKEKANKLKYVLPFSSTKEGMLQLIEAQNYTAKDSTNRQSIAELENKFGFQVGSSKGKFLELHKLVTKQVAEIRKNQDNLANQGFINVTPEQIAGYTAAEGYFSVSISLPTLNQNKKPKAPTIVLSVCYTAGIHERNVLRTVAATLNIDAPKIVRLKQKKANILLLTRVDELNTKVIPFFAKASFDYHEMKHAQFLMFIEIFQAVRNKEHLTKTGFIKIVNRLFSTTSRNNHSFRKFSQQDCLKWANNNWAQTPDLQAIPDNDSTEIDEIIPEEILKELF